MRLRRNASGSGLKRYSNIVQCSVVISGLADIPAISWTSGFFGAAKIPVDFHPRGLIHLVPIRVDGFGPARPIARFRECAGSCGNYLERGSCKGRLMGRKCYFEK